MSLSNWILRLITWDGLLPAIVWVVPYIVSSIFPNTPGVIWVLGVLLPIAAFFIRYQAGRRFISTNHCGNVMRIFQVIVFCFAILIIVLIDAAIVLSHAAGAGVRIMGEENVIVIIVSFAIYFLSMAFSMYPGYEKVIECDPWSNEGHFSHRSEET